MNPNPEKPDILNTTIWYQEHVPPRYALTSLTLFLPNRLIEKSSCIEWSARPPFIKQRESS